MQQVLLREAPKGMLIEAHAADRRGDDVIWEASH